MKKTNKAESRRSRLLDILERLRNGIVIVEGKHDVGALGRLEIPATSYNKFLSCNSSTTEFSTNRTFYIMMDADKGGRDKENKVISLLTSMNNAIDYNTALGKSLLHLLGITSVEQACGRVEWIMNGK
jgi:5S rRNA maturation endonuclease (ribonuclease M5)